MSDHEIVNEEAIVNPIAETETATGAAKNEEAQEVKKLKRNNLKDGFKEKSDQVEKESKPPMSKEETTAFYQENLPFMRLQDEYEELLFKFSERKLKNKELQVRSLEIQAREIEAIGYLAQWKAGQDDAQRRQEHEAKMKEEWDAMTPEQQAEYTARAKENLQRMNEQANTGAGMGVVYDGTNAAQVLCFTEGTPYDENRVVPFTNEETKQICFPIPDQKGGMTELCMVPGQLIERLDTGEFIVSFQ